LNIPWLIWQVNRNQAGSKFKANQFQFPKQHHHRQHLLNKDLRFPG